MVQGCPDSGRYRVAVPVPCRTKGVRNMGTQPPRPRYPIESVDNALRLIVLLGEHPFIGVSEASELLGVVPSTAHRLLAMLQHHRFAQQDTRQKTYVAGPALVEAGLGALRNLDIRAQARPAIERLVATLGETAHLCVLQGANVLFLDCVEGNKALRAASRTGQSLPAHCTAAGRILLAAMPDERLLELYAKEKLEGLTPKSTTSRTKLIAGLASLRKQGYAVNLGESEAGLRAVAASIIDRAGRIRGAITVAAPESRMSTKDIPAVARAIRAAARSIGNELI